jgi:hypothetical protein
LAEDVHIVGQLPEESDRHFPRGEGVVVGLAVIGVPAYAEPGDGERVLVLSRDGLDIARGAEVDGLIGLALGGGPGSDAGKAEDEDSETAW